MSGPDLRCPGCGGDAGDNWFDRSLCPCDDVMHTRCRSCGIALDGCPYDSEEPQGVFAQAIENSWLEDGAA